MLGIRENLAVCITSPTVTFVFYEQYNYFAYSCSVVFMALLNLFAVMNIECYSH
jgi:hypothetical protein